MTRRVSALVVAGFLVLLGAKSVAAQTYVEGNIKAGGRQHVIISITPGREAEVIAALAARGGSVRSQHPSINGIAADINGSDVTYLAQHGAAVFTRDQSVHLSATKATAAAVKAPVQVTTVNLDPNAPQTDTKVSTLRLTLGLKAGSSANLASGVVNGSGVGIAIIDSGFSAAAAGDFTNPVKLIDFTNLDKKGNPTFPVVATDELGHGTHIAGLIASSGALSNYMFQGVAPNARLVALKVLNKDGASKTSTVIAAIEYVVKNSAALGVQVINLSLGHPVTAPAKFDPLVQAVEDAIRHNLTVVVAAGNDGPGYGSVNSPGNSPSAVTVGAADGKLTVTRADDYVPSFSSKGPTWYDGLAKPDVVAQGVNLYSDAAPGSTLLLNPNYPHETVGKAVLVDLSGTSMATAVATGVVALEYDANRNQASSALTPNTAKAILEYTAIKMPKADALTQGAGQINAAGAAQLAGSINNQVAVNSWWLQTGVSGSSNIGGSPYAWSQNIIWGTSLITGRFMFSHGLMFDDNIIWGTGTIKNGTLLGTNAKVRARANDNIIWGTDISVVRKNLVFGKDGDNIIWGTSDDNIIWGTHLTDFRVIGERVGSTIVWDKDDADNIIWGTLGPDNIIWGTDDGDNIIWGTWAADGDNIIWGTTADDNIIWGTSSADDNIIWGTSAPLAKIVHGKAGDNIIWGTADSDNIIWGTADSDNIIWGTSDDNIIWGTDDGDNIIWGTADSDNIIWGTSVGGGK